MYPIQKKEYPKFSWESKTFTNIEDIFQKNFFNLENGMCKEISQYAFDNPKISGVFTIKNQLGEFLSQSFFKVDIKTKTLIFDDIAEYYFHYIDKEVVYSISDFVNEIKENFKNIDKVITLVEPGCYTFPKNFPKEKREVTLWERNKKTIDIFTLKNKIKNMKIIDKEMFIKKCVFKEKETIITEENDWLLSTIKFREDYVEIEENRYLNKTAGKEVSYYEIKEDGFFKINDKTKLIDKESVAVLYPNNIVVFSKKDFNENFEIV